MIDFTLFAFRLLLSCCAIMTSACTFHGIIGIQDATPYAVDKKRYWKMDEFVPLLFETDTSGDYGASHPLLCIVPFLPINQNRTSVQTSSKKQMKRLQMPQNKLPIILLC
jgi:hypothetical protein